MEVDTNLNTIKFDENNKEIIKNKDIKKLK